MDIKRYQGIEMMRGIDFAPGEVELARDDE